MKYFLTIFFSFFVTLVSSLDLKVGDAVYFNARGGNPQEYLSQPLNLFNRLIEVPNIITKIEKSPYDRPFLTKSNSTIVLPNDEKVYVELNNFRDLKIYDENNNILLERQVSGATSIYEYKFEDKVIAWGVGWHNGYSMENGKLEKRYYKGTDFTILRTYIPFIKRGKIQLDDVSLHTSLTKFKEFIIDSKYPIFTNATDYLSHAKVYWCYYCGFEFFEISNTKGYVPINKRPKQIMKKYDIDFSSTENLVPSLKYLAQEKKDFSLFKEFLKNNYKQIISNLLEKYYFYTFYDENGVVDERELNLYVEKSKLENLNLNL